MTIVPSGVPVWGRAASFANYGGSLEKRDYGGFGAVNALTDVSAAQLCRLTSDAAAVSRVAPLCTMVISRSASVFTVTKCVPLWASALTTSYAGASAPTGYPSVTLISANTAEVTLPSTATDEFGVAQAILANAVIAAPTVSWDGTITAGAFSLTGFTDGLVVTVQVW